MIQTPTYYADLYMDTSVLPTDMVLATNVAAIQTSLNNILSIISGEAVMNPNLGVDASLTGFLFGPLSMINAILIKDLVYAAITENESRISNLQIEVVLDDLSSSTGAYIINIFYNIENFSDTQQLTFILQNNR